jgi:DNA repair exonuclease SbcCD nuclease subunit
VLCTGDLHVGRRPSRLADGVDARGWSCACVWNDIVDYAVRERVDLLLISGDWVDHDNRFYEAFGPLERGLRRLEQAGVDTLAVAGNHDYDVLPRLATQLAGDGAGNKHFRLLGRDGRWERHTVRRDGRPPVHVDGWSFPRESVLENPLRDYPRPAGAGDGCPVIALLHADLDQPQSRYAPVAISDLRGAAAVTLWLLGHIHAGKLHDSGAGPLVLYPGSPQAMDPGEPSQHGPWLLEIDGTARRVRPVHLPMSKVRYDRLTVDVTGVATDQDLEATLSRAIRQHAASLADCCGPLEYASLRLVLTGRSPLHRRLRACCEPIRADLQVHEGNFCVRVERIEVETRPAFDLEQLARNNDAPAVLARVLLGLEARGPGGVADAGDGADALLSEVAQRLADVYGAKAYRNIATDPPPDAAAARRVLARQAYLLLDELLAQREVPAEEVAGAL